MLFRSLALEGRTAEASQELEGLPLEEINWLSLPEWCREPLFEIGAGSHSNRDGS